jgi:hypothetical protein
VVLGGDNGAPVCGERNALASLAGYVVGARTTWDKRQLLTCLALEVKACRGRMGEGPTMMSVC